MAPLPPWLKESWVEYGVGVAIIFLRIFARTKSVGLRGWQGDDYIIIVALACYTSSIYCLQGIAVNGINTNVSTEMAMAMTEAQRHKVMIGSKQNVGVWVTYTTFLWCLKSCILFLYKRLHFGLWQKRTIYFTAALVVLTFIAVQATILGHCYPLKRHWQVLPYPGDCVPTYSNFYVVGSTNFVTDAIIISIPLPILWKARMSIRRKLLLSLLLCSGVFIMVATALRTILSLLRLYRDHGKNMGEVLIWCSREMLVAIVVVNAPCIKPLFSSSTWLRQTSYNYDHSGDSNKQSKGSDPSSNYSNGDGTTDKSRGSVSKPRGSVSTQAARGGRRPSVMAYGYIPESRWSKSDLGDDDNGSKKGGSIKEKSDTLTVPEPVLTASVSKGIVVIRQNSTTSETERDVDDLRIAEEGKVGKAILRDVEKGI